MTANRYIAYMTAVLRGHIANKKIPIFVTLCLTNRCNLKCRYCYTEYYERNHPELTTREALDLIAELSEAGTRYISLNGGEALLRDDLDAIVDEVIGRRILCHIATNGLLVKDKIPTLRKIDSLSISLDGAREGNDLNRGEGVYDKVIEAIECLHKNHIKFHTHTVLTKNNKNAINEIMPLARKYGFMAQFSTLRIEDSPDKDIGLSDDELRGVVRKIINYKRLGYPIFFSNRSYTNLLNWPFPYNKLAIFEEAPERYRPIQCFIKRFSCHIEANGFVYPCIVLVNKFKAVNLLKDGFRKAWESLATNQCNGCYNICCSDLNLIYGFDLGSIWNAIKIVLDRTR